MNIQKMIEKLDVLQKEDEYNIPDYDILREILEAGRESSQDKQFVNRYEGLVNMIKQINRRIEAIESKCSCKVKFKENVEKRLMNLEAKEITFENKKDTIEIDRHVAEEWRNYITTDKDMLMCAEIDKALNERKG